MFPFTSDNQGREAQALPLYGGADELEGRSGTECLPDIMQHSLYPDVLYGKFSHEW